MVIGYWANLTTQDFTTLPSDTVAILPLGATEQHGPHLPLSVDTDLGDAVIERTMSLLTGSLSVLVLPSLAITRSVEHTNHPGTLSLSSETMMAVLKDVGASVARAGVERLILFNAHGGNTAILEVVARDLRVKHGMIVVSTSWSAFADWSTFEPDALAKDLHAGHTETSAMLATNPSVVDMGAARNFETTMSAWQRSFPSIGLSGQAMRPAWIIGDLNEDGVCGNATAATKEQGEALIESAARNFAVAIEEFARFDHRGSGL